MLFILLHYATNIDVHIYLDNGTGKNRRIIDVTEMANSFGPDYSSALLGLYVFTGEDTISAFKGKGKVLPLKKMQKYLRFSKHFNSLALIGNLQMNFNHPLKSLSA